MSNRPAESQRAVTLIALLRRTSRLMVEQITERMEAAGFPDSPARHHPVFENLDPEGTRVTTLADRAGVSHQAMGELVAELEARRLVVRTADPSDGRARLVCLTDAGQEVVREALHHIAAIERQWARHWRQAGLEGNLRAALQAALAAEQERGR